MHSDQADIHKPLFKQGPADYGPSTKNGFYFKRLKKKKSQKKNNVSTHVKSIEIQILISVNKVLLEFSSTNSFISSPQLLMAELSSCKRDHMAHKPHIYYLTPYRMFANPRKQKKTGSG